MPNFFGGLGSDFLNDDGRKLYIPIAIVSVIGNYGVAIYAGLHYSEWCSSVSSYLIAVMVGGFLIGSINLVLLILDLLTWLAPKCCSMTSYEWVKVLRYDNRSVIITSGLAAVGYLIVTVVTRQTVIAQTACSATPNLLTFVTVVIGGLSVVGILIGGLLGLLGCMFLKDVDWHQQSCCGYRCQCSCTRV